MSKYNFLVLAGIVGAVVNVGNSYAGGGDKCAPNGPCISDNTATISWDQFRESCLHPEQFNSQIPPSNIRVQCTDTATAYVQTTPGNVALPSNRVVTYAVFSNKYHVSAEQAVVPPLAKDLAKGGSCLRFKEVENTVTVEKRLTCDDVLGIKSSLAEYCASSAAITKSANPKLVDARDTGRVIDTCSGVSTSEPHYGKPTI